MHEPSASQRKRTSTNKIIYMDPLSLLSRCSLLVSGLNTTMACNLIVRASDLHKTHELHVFWCESVRALIRALQNIIIIDVVVVVVVIMIVEMQVNMATHLTLSCCIFLLFIFIWWVLVKFGITIRSHIKNLYHNSYANKIERYQWEKWAHMDGAIC